MTEPPSPQNAEQDPLTGRAPADSPAVYPVPLQVFFPVPHLDHNPPPNPRDNPPPNLPDNPEDDPDNSEDDPDNPPPNPPDNPPPNPHDNPIPNPHGNDLVQVRVNSKVRKSAWVWLVCLWLGVAVMGIWAEVLGDVQVLRTGRDMYGNVCGLGDLKDLPMTYFPDPLESMDIALCVAACPLESIPEYIRIYNPDLATFEADIWYDSYPSRPLYNSYCLPAQAHLRLPVQSKLFSRDYSYTFVLRDIIEGGNALVVAAMGTLAVMSLFFGLFHIIRCQKWVYAGSTFLLIAELGYLSYGLYIEPERQMADLCGDYNLVHMQDCSLPVEDYRELFKACIVVFWAVLVVVTQLSKSKNEGLEQFKELKEQLKKLKLRSRLAWLLILIMGSSVFIIITCCILGFSSIGTSTLQVSDFEYPIQTWEYDYTLRCVLTVWCLVTGMWTLSWLSQAVLFVCGMGATQTKIGRIKQN